MQPGQLLLRTGVLICIFGVSGRGMFAALDEEPKRAPGAANDAVRKRPIRELIDALASKNAPPEVFGESKRKPEFPDNFDWEEQVRVVQVWEELNTRVEEALPELIASYLNDKRYCVTACNESVAGVWGNYNVGTVCARIVSRNIEPFEQPFFGGVHFLPRTGEAVRDWWQERRHISLAQLQLDAIALEREKWIEASRNVRVTDSPTPAERDRQKANSREIAALDRLANRIESKGKPIRREAVAKGFEIPKKPPIKFLGIDEDAKK